MAKLTKERKVEVMVNGEPCFFTLRQPTNEEFNKFSGSRWKGGRRGSMEDCAVKVRCELFDKLLVKVEDLEDESGPIAVDGKDRIPVNIKSAVVFELFEVGEVSEKNF